MEAKTIEMSKKLGVQKEHQKQLLTAFTKTICSYLEINEKTKDMVANAFNQKLLVIEKQMIRLNFVEELSKTSQKIEGQHPSKLASKDLMECSNDAFFLTDRFLIVIEEIEKSKENFSLTAKFNIQKLKKIKQELFDECFKVQHICCENKLQLIADEGPIDRELNLVRKFLAMKRQRLEQLNEQKDGKNDRLAILQKRKELLQTRLKEVTSPEASKITSTTPTVNIPKAI